MPRRAALLLTVCTSILLTSTVRSQGKSGHVTSPPRPAIEASVLTSMPVKELTVFKDGHAFVLHEATLPTDTEGDVVLDTLPTPVLGTFWPYTADERAKLAAVVAGKRTVRSERSALSLRELIESNPQARVTVIEQDDAQYEATLVGIPGTVPPDDTPAAAASAAAQTPQPPEGSPRGADFVYLRVATGTKVLPLSRIRTLLFHDEFDTMRALEERRNLLTLQLDWGDRPPAESAQVGMVYLQRGVRWIPNYRVDIDGEGHARVKLQATLVNELVDLDGVTTHLVIGVPSFRFADLVDPIALQGVAARLGGQYRQVESQFQQAFDNAVMAQTIAYAGRGGPTEGVPDAAADTPEIMVGSRSEDLYIFTLPAVTLRKGERMVVTVAEFTLPYKDVFALDVDFAPPPELEHQPRTDTGLAALLARSPRVMHRIRLQNTSRAPLTTAPAIILRDGGLLAQSLMTYTATGAACDLDVTTAVGLRAEKLDTETQRTPDAIRWGSEQYGRIDLQGRITITSFREQPVAIEVTRAVLGTADTATPEGRIEQTNTFEDVVQRYAVSRWWGRYDWPYWWARVNGIGRITWNVTVPPGEPTTLTYTWHYFWR